MIINIEALVIFLKEASEGKIWALFQLCFALCVRAPIDG